MRCIFGDACAKVDSDLMKDALTLWIGQARRDVQRRRNWSRHLHWRNHRRCCRQRRRRNSRLSCLLLLLRAHRLRLALLGQLACPEHSLLLCVRILWVPHRMACGLVSIERNHGIVYVEIVIRKSMLSERHGCNNQTTNQKQRTQLQLMFVSILQRATTTLTPPVLQRETLEPKVHGHNG